MARQIISLYCFSFLVMWQDIYISPRDESKIFTQSEIGYPAPP